MNLQKYKYSPVQFGAQPDKTKTSKFNHPDNGSITVINKAGDECCLEYENGKIKRSFINDRPYKEYYYYDYIPIYAASEDLKQRHTFADGTKLNEDQFWHDEGVQYQRILNVDDNYKACQIIRPNNPKYKNEPVLTIKNGDEPAKTFIRTNGKERIEFQTIKEARDYFMEEYGIEADFNNLKQAFLTKDALDEFLKLDDKYANNVRKLLPLLVIKAKENIANKEDDEEGTCVYCRGNTICFDTDYNWDEIETDFLNSYKKEFHPYHLAKCSMIHELGHFFHYIDSPAFFKRCCDDFQNDDERMLAKQVSGYATRNPREFVAEYITGKIAGRTYSKEVDDLYEKYHDPDFKDRRIS